MQSSVKRGGKDNIHHFGDGGNKYTKVNWSWNFYNDKTTRGKGGIKSNVKPLSFTTAILTVWRFMEMHRFLGLVNFGV